ncbi:MAG: hypothetical protein K0R38_7800 [Polyangiaceae bacterium]|jgi:hypothetical protein|nr:hypothetical protein [Polyangiaceae bacterium]
MAPSTSTAIVPFDPAPMRLVLTPAGYRVACYAVPLDQFPVDFFADPDGRWTYEGLAEAAGFAMEQGVAIGVLSRDHFGHPEGSAIVTLNAESRPYVAVVECPIAYTFADPAERTLPVTALDRDCG